MNSRAERAMPRRAERALARRAERALTLLEVMAAVALLGIVYAYLARAASQGILTSGESRWRLEASLLADQELADLEREMRAGAPLELGRQDPREEGDFTVARRIEVWSLPAELMPPRDPDSTGPSLLGRGPNDALGTLRRVRVRVAWFDGVRDQHIERVTFVYDTLAAANAAGLQPGLAIPGVGP